MSRDLARNITHEFNSKKRSHQDSWYFCEESHKAAREEQMSLRANFLGLRQSWAVASGLAGKCAERNFAIAFLPD